MRHLHGFAENMLRKEKIMQEKLQLKSSAIRVKDYHEIDVSSFRIPLTLDEEQYQKDLTNMKRRFAEVVDGEKVEKGDIVIFDAFSDNPRFNRNGITVRVGMGLYSKEIEARLIGMKVGEEGDAIVSDGKLPQKEEMAADTGIPCGIPVHITVNKIRHEVLPEITDELAAKCGIPEIETAEDLYRYCKGMQFDEQLDEAANDAFVYLNRQTAELSEMVLDPWEQDVAKKTMIDEVETIIRLHELQNEEGSDSVKEEASEPDSNEAEWDAQAFYENAVKSSDYLLKSAVLGQELMRDLPDEEVKEYYDNFCLKCEGSYLSLSPEERERSILIEMYATYYMDEVEGYALWKLKEGL